nr:MAG TPA: hypothetical protein [Caudoviricetes sp.]
MRRACKSGRRVGIAAENGVYSIFNCVVSHTHNTSPDPGICLDDG